MSQCAAILEAPKRFSPEAFRLIMAATPERAMRVLVEEHVAQTKAIEPRFIAEGLVSPKGELFLDAVNAVASEEEVRLWVIPKAFIMESKTRQAIMLKGGKCEDDDLNLIISDYLKTLGFDRNSRPSGADHAFRLRRGMRALLAKQERFRKNIRDERIASRRTTLQAISGNAMTQKRYDEIVRDCRAILRSPLAHAKDLMDKALNSDHRACATNCCYWVLEGDTKGWFIKRTGHPLPVGLYEIKKRVGRSRYTYDLPSLIHSAWMVVVPKSWGLQATKRDMVVLPTQGKGVWVLLAATCDDRWLAIRIGDGHAPAHRKTVKGYGFVAIQKDGRAKLVESLEAEEIVSRRQ